MPKQTFFNLPEEKRQTLIEAAEKEFSKVPLMKASVANIIKMAGIPRGSFYQYFENIEDLYRYLLSKEAEKRQVFLISLLKKHNGDLFDTVTEMYDSFLIELPDDQEHTFLRNAMLNLTNKDGFSLADVFYPSKDKDHHREILSLIDKKRLNINNNNELIHIIQILIGVAFRNFIEKYSKELSDEEAISNFTIELNLLKKGLYKQKAL